jgi:hypothetical protein
MRARQVTVGTTATLIANGGTRTQPDHVIITVPTGGATVYIGDASVNTTTLGFPVVAGATFTWPMASESIYGIVAASTQVVTIVESGN